MQIVIGNIVALVGSVLMAYSGIIKEKQKIGCKNLDNSILYTKCWQSGPRAPFGKAVFPGRSHMSAKRG